MLFFAVWNGDTAMRLNYFNVNEDLFKKYTKYFHYEGWILRILIVVMFWKQWLVMLILINLSYTAYELLINWRMRQNWLYVGNTSDLDKLVTKYGLTGKKLIIIFKILLLICIPLYIWHDIIFNLLKSIF
jgi:hypothetical protein